MPIKQYPSPVVDTVEPNNEVTDWDLIPKFVGYSSRLGSINGHSQRTILNIDVYTGNSVGTAHTLASADYETVVDISGSGVMSHIIGPYGTSTTHAFIRVTLNGGTPVEYEYYGLNTDSTLIIGPVIDGLHDTANPEDFYSTDYPRAGSNLCYLDGDVQFALGDVEECMLQVPNLFGTIRDDLLRLRFESLKVEAKGTSGDKAAVLYLLD